MFLKKLSYTKKCTISNSYGNCWHNSSAYNFLNGTVAPGLFGSAPWNLNVYSSAILTNGSLVSFFFDGNWCAGTTSHGPPEDCGTIIVDVNGFKPPNTVGKDIFGVYVSPQDGVMPFSWYGCDETVSDTNGSGWGCSSINLLK